MTDAISTRHGTLACTTSGRGPQLILLPANGHDARDFAAIRSRLDARFETTALDWPAMGASKPLPSPERTSALVLAEMLEDAVTTLARGPVLLLGHSVGGFAAARLAARHPALVRALILVDAGGFTSPGPLERLFCRVKGRELVTRLSEGAFARFHTKRRNEGVARMFARIDAARRDAAYASTVAAVWRSFGSPEHDLTALAPSIVCPTLLLWGALDPVLPLATAGRAAERAIPGARLAKLATGHCPFVEDPARFLAELEPFLERVVSRGTPRPCSASRVRRR